MNRIEDAFPMAFQANTVFFRLETPGNKFRGNLLELDFSVLVEKQRIR